MRALLSTIGSRGDVQPLVALALKLREAGHDARICVPPDFGDWIEGLDIPFTSLGPTVRWTAKTSMAQATPEQIRQMMAGTVATQFATLPAAAEGCDVIVAANALNVAARSVAERLGIRYVFAAYCPVTLPSAHHAPPKVLAWVPGDASADNRALWAEDAMRWNERWGPALNNHRGALGMPPVDDVRGHILSDMPWLAADATLAPWPEPADAGVLQTGAWTVQDQRPLSPELQRFLDAGDAPVYLGFGSIRAPQDLATSVIDAARALGRRVIVSRGWADLDVPDDQPDCLAIGEVNQQALFRRVAAVVHHGGAGTTTAAAGAGAPQVIIPQHHDQPYFARRVDALGIGRAHPPGAPTVESLATTLERALQREVAERARTVAKQVTHDGAELAVRHLTYAA